MYARLKNIRKRLHFTQEFVAKQMNLDRSAIVAIESNRRKVTADELKNFSELYNVSLEEIVYGKPKPVENKPSKISTLIKKFSNLSTSAQNEILNFIEFKTHYQLDDFQK